MKGRILAVDWGERRIGLALSDETQTLAQPLTTLTRRAGKRFPMAQLLDHVTRNQVVGIIVGLPLNEAGAEGDAAHAAREVADAIKRRVDETLEVTMWDERMTTARVLAAVREMGGKTRGRKEDVDAMAAGGASGKSDAEGGANLGSNVPPNYIKTYDEGRPRH